MASHPSAIDGRGVEGEGAAFSLSLSLPLFTDSLIEENNR